MLVQSKLITLEFLCSSRGSVGTVKFENDRLPRVCLRLEVLF